MATEAAAQSTDAELQAAAWKLDPLVDGHGADGARAQLAQALERARTFAQDYTGKLVDLDSEELAAAMNELGEIQELVGRAGTYAGLCFSVDTADPAAGALMQEVQERGTEIETTLLFFELEWAALADERVDRLLSDERLAFCAHYLRTARRYREHLLTEPEEKILAEKAVTGSSAWSRLFDELTSAIEVSLPDEKVALDVALSRLALPDRELRRSTAEAVTTALAPGLRTRAYLFNTLLADKAIDDRLRRYPSWLASRN
ncbi:MAG TPA: oligoendopeptidase, partial [Solirubrobacteraceae bacterium]|nr:oligoendopeptidase [Solirubrobacteraceae bacterium]